MQQQMMELVGTTARRVAESMHVMSMAPFLATVQFDGKRCDVVSVQNDPDGVASLVILVQPSPVADQPDSTNRLP